MDGNDKLNRVEDKQKALLAIIIGAFIGGATVPLTKLGLQDFPPLSFAFLRFAIASFCIIPILLNYKRIFNKELKTLILVTLFASSNILLFILGITTTTATIGQFLYTGVPLLTGVIGYIFLKQTLPKLHIVGIFIGFIGVTTIIFLPVLEKGNPFSGDLVGNLLISAGVISWSIYMAFSKKILYSFSPFIVTSAFILITTLVLLPFFIFENINGGGWLQDVSIIGWISIIYVATISTVGIYFLNQYAIKHGGVVFASMVFYLFPITTYIIAFLLLGELLTLGLILGGALALVGVFLVTRR